MPPLSFTLIPGRFESEEVTQTYKYPVYRDRVSVKGKPFTQRYWKKATRVVKRKKFIPDEAKRITRGFTGYIDEGDSKFHLTWMKVVYESEEQEAIEEADKWLIDTWDQMIWDNKHRRWSMDDLYTSGAPVKFNHSNQDASMSDLGKFTRVATWNGVNQIGSDEVKGDDE